MALGSKFTKGIEIEISGKTTKLKTALDDANRSIRSSQSELKTLQKNLELEWNPASFKRAQELAQRSLQQTRDKADILRKALAEIDSQGAGKDTERYEAIRRELSYVEGSARKAAEELKKLNSLPLDKLKAELSATADSLDKMGNKLTLGLTAPLVAAGVASSNFASDTVESVGKVEVAFGYAAEGIKKWSDSTLTSIGLAKGTALDMAALYGDMATSMGFAKSQAADMAKSLVNLGADLASYKNISIDVANTALKSIFTGETESLKGLGVVMTQANLQAYAMAQGFKTAYKDMNQAQQVAVRYQYVLAQTSNAQGDFARTSDNTANQLRVLQESLKEAASLAGDQLLPIITPIVGKLSDLIQSFGDLDEGTRKAVVQTALFVAGLGPMLKLTGGVTTAISAGVAAYTALTAAKAADTAVTAAQTAATTTATAAQTGLNVAMSANPIGAVVTAVGALVAVLGAWIAVTALTTENQNKLTESIEKSRAAYQGAVDDIEESRTSTLGMMQSLEQLMAVEDKSAAQKAVIKGLVDQLNEAVPQLSLAYNEQADSLNMTSDALERYIETEARRQLQQESTDRLIELEKERIQIAEDLEKAQADLYLAQEEYNRVTENGTAVMDDYDTAYAVAQVTVGRLQGVVNNLTKAQQDNETESAALQAQYNDLSAATDKTDSAVTDLANSLDSAVVTEEELAKSTRTLTSETETLSAAFAEQTENGGLSLDTTLKLIEAGYGAALAVDEETGSVRLNAEAYATLAQKKIDEQISGIQDSQRETKTRLLQAEGDAALAAAMGHTALALSYQETAKAIQGELVSGDAMIAQLTKLRDGLDTVVTGKWSSKAPTTSKSKSKAKTAEELRVEDYKSAMQDLDYLRDMDKISEADYYARLEQLRDKYLTENSDEWRSATVKLHDWREKSREEEAKAEKEAAEQAAKAKQDAYDKERADQDYYHDVGLTSDSYYYQHLEELRDKYLEEDSEAWRKATVELYNWQQKQRDAALAAEKTAQEAAQKQRTDLVKQYTDERIAAIKAEQKAEEDRINALIDGIDEEIAARKRLREVEGDEDAIAKAQKTLEAAKAQLAFARDENTRRELEKEVARAQDDLDKAVQDKADNDWYYAKEQEKAALQDQLDAAKDKYQTRIDNASSWAADRVAEERARQREDDARIEKEYAEMAAAQKAAAGMLATVGQAVKQVTNATTNLVTNRNSVSITTGASLLTSGQAARLVEKALEKLAK
ncbi:MAG TPA: hypothetical protein VN421_09455 [Pseudoflavonifractor sp.]|nr:hypothetical protein [Pseudoflavonifractor sp.]